MDMLFKILLVIHVAAGSVGLLTGAINLVRRKGGKYHRITGSIFSYAMLTAGGSALALACIHPNYFLFIVGVFTIYMTGTGHRYIYQRLLGQDQKAGITDWVLTGAMAIFGFAFVVLGTIHLLRHNTFGIVFIVFGAVSLLFVKTDVNNYRGNIKIKNYWLLAHLQRMTGAFIASATAFLVVNGRYFPGVPSVVMWLLPAAILVPLIIKWSRKYEIKGERK